MVMHAFLAVVFTVLVIVKTSEPDRKPLPRLEDVCKVKNVIKTGSLQHKVICEDGRELENE